MPNHGVTWLASYPKSGSTWLRFICFHLAHQRSPATSRELDAFINSRTAGLDQREHALVKTHAAATRLAPLAGITSRAVYIHRHPLDVLCSALNYDMLTGGADLSLCFDEAKRRTWIDGYIEAGGYARWRGEPYLSETWSQNVRSWTGDNLPFPALVLAYDELSQSPEAAIQRIGEFLELPCDLQGARRCAEETSFEALRRFEERELEAAWASGEPQGRFSGKARLRAAREGLRFFSSGRSGGYRELLSPEQIRKGREVFGAVATGLGYEI